MEVVKGRLVQGILIRFHPGVSPQKVLKLVSLEIKVHGISLPVERRSLGRLGGDNAKVSS
jgi:hypothetical protein